jgi:hypothetical protein
MIGAPRGQAQSAEIGYAFDTLGADGVILDTNAHGIYPGDQRLDPVFAELARRRATVLLHPASPPCWQQTALGRPRPMIEFIFDTARARLLGSVVDDPARQVCLRRRSRGSSSQLTAADADGGRTGPSMCARLDQRA